MDYKPFSKSLYDANNSRGCRAAIDFLSKFNYTLYDATERYKLWDLVFKKDNTFLKVEVEVSSCWTKDDEWQGYRSLTCPHRKKDSRADIYMMFNSSLNACAVVPMKRVTTSPIIRKNTKYTTNEPFFNVSLFDVDFFFKTNPDTSYSRFIK